MLEIKNITKSFERLILDDISIDFPSSGLFFIKGESGTGKTTLINIIAGFLKQDAGEIIYDGQHLAFKDMENFRKENISFMFQDYGIINHFSIKDNVLLSECILKELSSDDEIRDVLLKVGVNKNINDKCFNLSGGEKQRLAIARILINPKNIILLDEPSSSLDKENFELMFSLLKELSSKKLIIVVSHNEEIINAYADYIYDLNLKRLTIKNKIKNKNIKQNKKLVPLNLGLIFKIECNSLLYRKYRYIVSIISMALVCIITVISLIFSMSINVAKEDAYTRYIDSNRIQVSFQESENIGNSNFKVISQFRPDMNSLRNSLKGFRYDFSYNIDYLFSSAVVSCGEEEIFCLIKPINYLIEGKYCIYSEILSDMTHKDFLVNKSFYAKVKDRISLGIKTSFITYDENYNFALDSFIFDETINIIDVIDEFEFMNVPTIYYSYNAWIKLISNKNMINTSKLLKYDVSYYDRFSSLSGDKEEVSSYCYDIYVKHSDLLNIKSHLEDEGYYIYSSSLETLKNLSDIFESVENILIFFDVITLMVFIFLCEMIFYSFIMDRKKEIGLLNAYGVNKNTLIGMFLFEIIFVVLVTFILIITILSSAVSLVNDLIFSITELNNFMVSPGLYFFILLAISLIVLSFILVIVPALTVKKLDTKTILMED